MKKYLALLFLAPLAVAACDDNDNIGGVPAVSGSYTTKAGTTCEDLDTMFVEQSGQNITVFFEDNSDAPRFKGTIDEDGDFEVNDEIGSCSGRFDESDEFGVTCTSSGTSCKLVLEKN